MKNTREVYEVESESLRDPSQEKPLSTDQCRNLLTFYYLGKLFSHILLSMIRSHDCALQATLAHRAPSIC